MRVGGCTRHVVHEREPWRCNPVSHPQREKPPPSSGVATPCCFPQRETLTGLDRAREEESQSRENPESESHIERKGGRAPFNHAQVPCSITLHPIKLQVSGETFSLFSRFGSRKSIRDSVIHEHAPRSALTGRATPASRSPRTAAPDAAHPEKKTTVSKPPSSKLGTNKPVKANHVT